MLPGCAHAVPTPGEVDIVIARSIGRLTRRKHCSYGELGGHQASFHRGVETMSLQIGPAPGARRVECGISVALLYEDGELLVAELVDGRHADTIADGRDTISRRSPVGAAVCGRVPGDVTEVHTEEATWRVEILACGEDCAAVACEVIRLQTAREFAGAASLLRAHGSFASAARRYLQPGDVTLAAECYALAGDCAEAAGLFEACGAFARAGECWQAAGCHRSAAMAYTRAGAHAEAGRAFECARDWSEAAAQYRRSDDQSGVCRCLERVGDFEGAARAYAAAGALADAAACRCHAGDREGAEAMRARIELLAAEAVSWERSGAFRDAAVAYEQAGEHARAACCCEKAGCLDDAARCYARADCPDDVLKCRAQCAMDNGDWIAAADLFEQAAQVAWWQGSIDSLLGAAAACRRQPAGPNAAQSDSRPDPQNRWSFP